MLTDRENAIRAAALIDSDGSIHIQKQNHVLRCSYTSTDLIIPEWFKSIYGGNIYGHSEKRINRRESYNWIITAVGAEAVIRIIQPFLLLKGEQAELGLKLRSIQGRHLKYQNTAVRQQLMAKYYDEMCALNKVGSY